MRQNLSWQAFKYEAQSRRAPIQADESEEMYRLYFWDGPALKCCVVFKSTPPEGSGVTEEVNAAALADYEANFKATANLPVEAKTTDSVPFTSSSLFPSWALLYFTGSADSSSVRGEGEPFSVTLAEAGDVVKEFSFLDGVYTSGGGIFWRNANPGDSISLECHSNATPLTSTPGTGNCNLATVPGVGAILIVPAAGDGAYTVDFTNANPIPAIDDNTQRGTGYWNWSDPWTGKGEVSPSVPGKGRYNLFAIHIVLGRFANKIPLLGSGQLPLQVDTVKPKYFLPQWHWNVKVHREVTASPSLDVSFYLMTGRKSTT